MPFHHIPEPGGHRGRESALTLCGVVPETCSSLPDAVALGRLNPKRTLKGHTKKVYSMQWSETANELVSCGQEGVVIVWDGPGAVKLHAAAPSCSWVMTCGISPSGEFIASGGLDNICSVFDLSKLESNNGAPVAELAEHGGHLSSCRFLSNEQILTSSGDKTCILWNIETGKPVTTFASHSGDVLR